MEVNIQKAVSIKFLAEAFRSFPGIPFSTANQINKLAVDLLPSIKDYESTMEVVQERFKEHKDEIKYSLEKNEAAHKKYEVELTPVELPADINIDGSKIQAGQEVHYRDAFYDLCNLELIKIV